MSNTINKYLDLAEGNYEGKELGIEEFVAKLLEIMHSDERKHELYESELDDAKQQVIDSLMESEERKNFILSAKMRDAFPALYEYMQDYTNFKDKMNMIFESRGKTIVAKITFVDITKTLDE